MAALSTNRIAELLEPYLGRQPVPNLYSPLYRQLSIYLDLLLKWNGRTNLTAVREPEAIVQRHFGESLFAGLQLGGSATLLDFGSGAGFPGLPIQLLHPEMVVTLAESQNKKATFLREAVRVLGLRTEVWGGRVEAMPADKLFDCVTLRAVDNMDSALKVAQSRVVEGGRLAVLGVAGDAGPGGLRGSSESYPVPNSDSTVLHIVSVPRGTSTRGLSPEQP